jgi:hypothetical protein
LIDEFPTAMRSLKRARGRAYEHVFENADLIDVSLG